MAKRSREVERLQHELEVQKLYDEIRALKGVVRAQADALVESNKLLQKQKPARIAMSSDRKIYLAGLQHFKCAGDRALCPLWRLGDGSFDSSGWECDHIERWSVSFRNANNLQALVRHVGLKPESSLRVASEDLRLRFRCAQCPMCHNRKTREERILEEEEGA